MRTRYASRLGLVCLTLLLCSCAQQPTRDTPAPAAPSPAAAAKPQPAPVPAKPKTKPKPAPSAEPVTDTPKPETKEPEAAPAGGIDKAQVGYYFDTLQGRLRQSGDLKIVVTRRDSHITIDVTERVHFGGADAVNCAALAPIAKVLVEYRMTRVVVEVSAIDAAGANTAKSTADSLAHCLTAAGVASRRIAARNMGAAARASVYLQIEPIVKTP